MSTIIVRHSKLMPPYNNYDGLSLHDLDMLATERIQPHIDRDFALAKIQKYLACGLIKKGSVDAVYHSPSVRSRETAGLLAAELSIPEIEESDFLGEIIFSPKKLVSPAAFKSEGMAEVRERVYEAVEQGKGGESTRELRERITSVRKLIADNHNRNIVIVTHGFFMRPLQLALFENKQKFTVSDQRRSINPGYLEGFFYQYQPTQVMEFKTP